jgi:hypothetical protein
MLYSSFMCCSCLFHDFSILEILRLEANVRDCSLWIFSVAFAMACTLDSVAVFMVVMRSIWSKCMSVSLTKMLCSLSPKSISVMFRDSNKVVKSSSESDLWIIFLRLLASFRVVVRNNPLGNQY